MIIKHSIKKDGNYEVLYLYLDYSYEFGSFKNIKIIDGIKDYINKNKISFNGTKIILVVGSLFLGTLILNNNIRNMEDVKDDYIYVSKITLNNYNNKNKIESITKIDTKEKNVSTTSIKKKNVTNKKANTVKKVISNKTINKKNTVKKRLILTPQLRVLLVVKKIVQIIIKQLILIIIQKNKYLILLLLLFIVVMVKC